MNEVQNKEFKSILLAEKNKITRRLSLLEMDKTRKKGPLSADWTEQVAQKENDEVVDAIEDMDFKKLEKIESAIQRIENGSFGKCIECEDVISSERLNAVPQTMYCKTCIPDKKN